MKFFWLAVVLFVVCACGTTEVPNNCDFTEKNVNISIDEKSEYLKDDELLAAEIQSTKEAFEYRKEKAKEEAIFINSALPGDTDPIDDSLSKKGEIELTKWDLLTHLFQAKNSQTRKNWWSLWNEIRWSQLITNRDYNQICNKMIELSDTPLPVAPVEIESHFIDMDKEAISAKNLYYNYASKSEQFSVHDQSRIYRYIHQKTGRGFSTSFYIEDLDNGKDWKAKVGWESYREPLAAFLSWGLGFPVDQVFHLKDTKIEFNENLEKVFEGSKRNIADSLSAIILKSGEKIDLLATSENPDLDVRNIYQSNRPQIAYLVFKALEIERRDEKIVRVGQWDFDALENVQIQAVRMQGLLHFWLGNEDIKFDNNRILIYLTDSALSQASMPFIVSGAEHKFYTMMFVVHDLGLSFTANPSSLSNDLAMTSSDNGQVAFKSETRGRDVGAWRKLTKQDAEEFADRLSRLSENQFRQAVAAAGYPYPALVLMVEKLKSRRNYFLQTVSPGRYPDLAANPEFISSAEAGSVDIGESQNLLVPQDGFIVETGKIINDISLNFHGKHSEMLRE